MPGYFEKIEPDECRRMLSSTTVGRVCWISPTRGLQVLPVTYTMRDRTITFAVARTSVLGELAGPVEVAFQVDDIDASTSTGWSILVHGQARELTGPVDGLNLPWAPGERDLVIGVATDSVTGRLVSADQA